MADSSGSLDTNVLLRLLLNDIAVRHQAGLDLLQTATGQFTVADTAFIELVFVLERNYKLTRPQIAEAVEGLVALPQINGNRALLEYALLLFKAHSSLSFEDCCLATCAKLNQAEPLWTFDKKLSHQIVGAKLVKA